MKYVRDFKKLEAVLEKRLAKEQPAIAQCSAQVTKSKPQKAVFSVEKLKAEAQRIHNQQQKNSGDVNRTKKKKDPSL